MVDMYLENLAPIVIFCYKRPQHLDRMLTSLKTCKEFKDSRFYVFSDGPRSERDNEGVKAAREIIEKHDLPRLEAFYSDVNKGLASSVIAGLQYVFSKHSRVIVLEDDLVLSPFFLRYMNSALERYENVPEVATVAGYGFPTENPLPDLYFYRIASSWGWATWKRAWDLFEPDVDKLLAKFEGHPLLRLKFNVGGSAYFYQMLKAQQQGRIDSWAIRWAASVFLSGKLNLHAGGSSSYVQNEGHDGSGTHCASNEAFVTRMRISPPGSFPVLIEENSRDLKIIQKYYRSLQPGIYFRIKKKLLKLIKHLS